MKRSVTLLSTTAALAMVASTMLMGCDWFGNPEDAAADGVAKTTPPAAKVAQAPAIHRAKASTTKHPSTDATPAARDERLQRLPNDGLQTDESDDSNQDPPSQRGDKEAKSKPETKKAKADERQGKDDAPQKDLDAKLVIRRLVISKGVKGREPVGATNTFQQGAQQRIYAFVEVGNPDQVPSELYVSMFEAKSGKGMRVPIQVGAGTRWRTWIYTRNVNKAGKWRAVVKNAKGKTLASTSFEITAKPPTMGPKAQPAADSPKPPKAASHPKSKQSADSSPSPS